MKILHVCLACFYIDNYGYQENILPKFHKMMGHDVRIVASTETFDKEGQLTYTTPSEYVNENGILVTRLPYKKCLSKFLIRKIRRYVGLKKYLDDFKPDFIFLHDFQFMDIDIICKYAKKHNVKVSADCHSDFSNSARSFVSRHLLHGILYKHCARIVNPYVTKFYGVLPARVDFLKNVYHLPKDKCELLIMGVDDSLIDDYSKPGKIKAIRERFGIKENDFLVVFGGKIDLFKTQVFLLIDAVKRIKNVKLLIFGTVIPELKEKLLSLIDNEQIFYGGWQDSKGSFDIFSAANVACFPGRHSVYWEQAAGLGCPLIVKRWAGTEHVNINGNTLFLDDDSVEEIQNKIELLLIKANYTQLLEKANLAKTSFYYSVIAKKVIDDLN